MMKNSVFLLFVFLFGISSYAYSLECSPNATQMDLNQCAYDEYQQSDLKLNQVWKQLIKKHKNNTDYVEKLRVSQRTWIQFRDAEVAAMFSCLEDTPRSCWGSMYPMLYNMALSELTMLRAERLEHYLKRGQNNSVGG